MPGIHDSKLPCAAMTRLGEHAWTEIDGNDIEACGIVSQIRSSASGHFEYTQKAGGDTFKFGFEVTCMNVYGGNRAKIGGIVTQSSDPTIAVGRNPSSKTIGLSVGQPHFVQPPKSCERPSTRPAAAIRPTAGQNSPLVV